MRGVDDRPAPRAGAGRAPGRERLRQRGVADLQLHRFHWHRQRISRNLGQHGPGAVADVRRGDTDAILSSRRNGNPRGRGQLDGRIGRGRDACTDEPASRLARPRGRVARRPTKALGAFAKARHQSAAAEGEAGFRVDRRLVAEAQLDRVETTRKRQLVDRRLECEHPGGVAWRAHPGVRRQVELRLAMGGQSVGRRVHRPGWDGGGLGHLVTHACLRHRLMRNGCEATVALGAKPNALDGRRAVARQREHLLSRERKLRRPSDNPRRHYRHDRVRVRKSFGSKPAADVGCDDADVLGRKLKCPSDGPLSDVDPLTRVVDGQVLPADIVAPDCQRGVRLEGVVVLGGRRVGLVECDRRGRQR